MCNVKRFPDRCVQGAGQGGMCLVTEEVVESVEQQPGYSCHQRLEETCHDSLVTVFSPHQEEDCSEHFEKRCQISFTQEAATETLVTCYRWHQLQHFSLQSQFYMTHVPGRY